MIRQVGPVGESISATFRFRVAVLLESFGHVMSPCASIRLYAFTQKFPAEVRYCSPIIPMS